MLRNFHEMTQKHTLRGKCCQAAEKELFKGLKGFLAIFTRL